jgi:molybdopterin molybdotransferase
VRALETISISAPLVHFLRADVQETNDGLVARLTGPQGSGLISSMARANALLIVAPERARIEAGELVDALLIRDDVHQGEAVPFS